MENKGKWLAPIFCALAPLIPLSYLYTRNAEYLSALHVAYVGGAMAVVSLLGFWLLRALFRSRLSGLLGCLTAWVVFFALNGASTLVVYEHELLGYAGFLFVYGAVGVALTLAVAFAARKRRGGPLYPALMIFAGVLLAFNAVPALKIGIGSVREARAVDASAFKTQFSLSEDSPSPNVYWIHCDGMLGFDAFEKYYGDDQAEFVRALGERGFQINRGAMLEARHTTMIAVAALMCPDYYDRALREILSDHETASAITRATVPKSQLQHARLNNETRLAFEQKGYLSQTIGSINIYYPPVSDRVYVAGDSRGAYRLETGGDFDDRYLSIIQAGELAILLTKVPGNTFFNLVVKLGERGLLGYTLQRDRLAHALAPDALESLSRGKRVSLKYRMMLECLNDSSYARQPFFTILFNLGAHAPFTVDENGAPRGGDPEDIHAYAAQHRYAASMLLSMIDLILARDQDAVIVLQADHGLHSQTREQITDAFGEDAVLPLWNQVLSALRVPRQYRTGDEAYALSNPLNMSRYLVNTFVGSNYEYEPEGQ